MLCPKGKVQIQIHKRSKLQKQLDPMSIFWKDFMDLWISLILQKDRVFARTKTNLLIFVIRIRNEFLFGGSNLEFENVKCNLQRLFVH